VFLAMKWIGYLTYLEMNSLSTRGYLHACHLHMIKHDALHISKISKNLRSCSDIIFQAKKAFFKGKGCRLFKTRAISSMLYHTCCISIMKKSHNMTHIIQQQKTHIYMLIIAKKSFLHRWSVSTIVPLQSFA